MLLAPFISWCVIASTAAAQNPYTSATDSNGNTLPNYSPARPPAIPLAVRSPYTSAWQSTANNGTLNSDSPIFWPGNHLGWEGIVVVDGIAYEYLGASIQSLPVLSSFRSAKPQSVVYDSQSSNYTFLAGPVLIKASFFSPVTPKDICRSSIPLSYLTTSVESLDGQTHDVQFYSDINGAWITDDSTATLNATTSASTLYSWSYHLATSYTFGELDQFPQWGNFTYNTSPLGAKAFSFQSGYSTSLRFAFLQNHNLTNFVDGAFRGSGTREPIFAFAHDFGNVTEAEVRYTIGSIQTPIMRYLYTGGVASLAPWWARCYGDIPSLIAFHWNDYDAVAQLGADFEAQLKGDPEAYYSIVALSARQVMGAYVYAVPPSATNCGTTSSDDDVEPLMFQKEISSDGNVNTVDVLYPATPFFLWANPEMLRYTLNPLMDNQENTFYPNGYCMHDLGSNFPNATGHVEGNDEYMPVEESGNLILMSYAYYKFSGNGDWIKAHYPLLKQFAQYLIQFSLVPAAQLSTDDFAGTLVNQTNLAIKGIVGLQAMHAVALIAGEADDAANFSATASEYYQQWEYFAINHDPTGPHTVLAYEWRSSWGLLYNTYFDKLLNLGVVDAAVYAMQSAWYPKVSQLYGVPLDNRHHYTKSDWEIWTAATCEPETRRLFVNGLAYWLNETTTQYPFTDLYETIDTGDYPTVPNEVTFIARPVVGGHYALLALERSGQLADATAGNTTGSEFGVDSTDAVTIEVVVPTQASSDLGPAGTGIGSAGQVPYSFSTSTIVNASTTTTETFSSVTQQVTLTAVP
ncbi:hypothetical protein BX600DRAFT_420703 [Xylariales sp. PMI_506]|nr:hypothetical protein BX600DRAFT_420703 [Xylariales sp. PMI_506]